MLSSVYLYAFQREAQEDYDVGRALHDDRRGMEEEDGRGGRECLLIRLTLTESRCENIWKGRSGNIEKASHDE